MIPFEREMVVTYRLSIVTNALYLTIQLQFIIKCLHPVSNPQISGGKVGHFGAISGREG